MTKAEYMNELRKHLRRLPKKDYQNAMDYFEEYFTDAGPDNVQQAIQDLGSPAAASEQILYDLAMNTTKTPEKGMRGKLNAVWIVILAVFAMPLALPIALFATCMAIFVLLCAIFVGLFLFCLALLFLAASPFALYAGCALIISDFSSALYSLGIGFMMLGGGFLILLLLFQLTKWMLAGLIRVFRRLIGRRKSRTVHSQT